MATSGGSTIINDPSLQLMVDPLNARSYPGTGTALYDISTAPWTFTLQNSPTYNSAGYFTYNGTNQYASSGNAVTQSNVTTFFTSLGANSDGFQTWTVPTNFSPPWTVHAIGGSGGTTVNGYGGAGGGAYANITQANLNIAPSSTVYMRVGPGGAGATSTAGAGVDSWINISANSAPVSTTAGVLAKGGSGVSSNSGAAGGAAASCIGYIKNSGGNGGSGSGTGRGGGSGGAAGPGGAGGNGGAGGAANYYGGGGGGGASLTAAGAIGSNGESTGGPGGDNGDGYGYGPGGTAGQSGGGGGGGYTSAQQGAKGGNGDIWQQSSNGAYAGPGGGAGGNGLTVGGLYGGGPASWVSTASQGNGSQGIIVVQYTINNSIPATALSVCAWINQTAAGTIDTIISHSSATGTNNGWSLGISAAGKLQFVLNGVATYASTLASISTSTWTHVAATVSGTALTFYLNGVAQDTATIGSMSGTPLVMVIGSDPSNNYFNGSIGPITVNNRQLSATEIAQNFNATRGRYSV